LLPLVARGRNLGVLGLLAAGEGWTQDSRRLAKGIADELGVALDNASRYEEARHLADRDPVTGLYNHRYLHDSLASALHCEGAVLAVLMLDLDGFKSLNDTYGHPTGDSVLRHLATALRRTARTGDLLCRYGGDELAAILNDTDDAGAVSFFQRLRASLASEPFRTPTGEAVPIRISGGVAVYPGDGEQAADLLGRADANLYLAKTAGGDGVVVTRSGDEASSPEWGGEPGAVAERESRSEVIRTAGNWPVVSTSKRWFEPQLLDARDGY
jgi:diguanylate cyclase (GGDEF)-like protein